MVLITTAICLTMLISTLPVQLSPDDAKELSNDSVIESSIAMQFDYSSADIYQVDSFLEHTYLYGLDVGATVLDRNGNLYVAGTMRDTGSLVSFDPLGPFNSIYNMQDRPGIAPVSFVAKLGTDGDWKWVNFVEPKGGTTSGCDSTTIINESTSTVKSLAVSPDGSYLYMGAVIQGCIDFGSNQLVTGTSLTERVGAIVAMKTGVGSMRYVKALENTNGNKAGTIIPDVLFTKALSSGLKVYVAGTIKDATISTSSGSFSGGPDGDGYILRLSDSTTDVEIYQDTCSLNDGSSTSDCGGGIAEKVVEVVEDADGNLHIGVNVHFLGTESTAYLFGKTVSVSATTGSLYAYTIMFDEDLQHTSSDPPNELNAGKKGWQIRHAFLYQQTPMFVTGFVQDVYPLILQTESGTEVTNLSLSSGAGAWPRDILVHESTGIHLIVARTETSGHPVLSNGTSYYNLTHDGMYLVNFIDLDASFVWNTNLAPERNSPMQTYSHVNGRIGVVGKGQNDAYVAQSFTFSADSDGDGIPDMFDAYANIPSSSDPDNDGIITSIDNCPNHWNVDQANNDNDLYGDACDTDIDGDGITNTIPIDLSSPSNNDQCPFAYTDDLKDKDDDGCEDDSDADGVVDVDDICPDSPDGDDADGDGIPDGCDTYPDDFDNDNVPDSLDNCQLTPNPQQGDIDGDNIGDACDGDIDGDNVNNSLPLDPTNVTDDDCPFVNASGQDQNFDGCIDIPSPDNDTDGDGVLNHLDRCPGFDDSIDEDGDGIIDGCDDHTNDTDNDGVKNYEDNCIFVYNPNQANMGGNPNQGDACDSDIDGDNVTNVAPLHITNGVSDDKCPYVNASGQDSDGDGCIDPIEPVECEVCEENNTVETKPEGNTSSPLLDPDDVGTVVVVGGTGAALGGSTALGLLALRKLRDGGRYLGVEDGIVIVKHLPRVKKKDDDSDHYFQRGLIRQQEMTKSADPRSDDYVEFEEEPGASAEEILSANEEEASQ